MIDHFNGRIIRFGYRLLVMLVVSVATSMDTPAEQPTVPRPHIIVVVGAAGEEAYGKLFEEWASSWQLAAGQSQASIEFVGDVSGDTESNNDDDPSLSDRERLREAVESVTDRNASSLWLVMIGHGTFFKEQAKFNLRGPDVSAGELAEWLKPITLPTIVINASSSSGPFVNAFSREGRIVVTATKSGTEENFARFGGYFAKAIVSTDADIDHDDEVSLLEAFLRAAGETKLFYEDDGRIVTENALIDDNGDGLGTPAEMYDGLYAKPPKDAKRTADGRAAARMILVPAADPLRLTPEEEATRAEIEAKLDAVRAKRSTMDDAEYDRQLEELLVPLSKLYRDAEKRAESEKAGEVEPNEES